MAHEGTGWAEANSVGKTNATAAGVTREEIPRAEAPHVRSLDGFRGLAFLLIFARHYSLTSHSGSRVMATAMAAGQGGWIGVDLFFTLSGLLITGILLDTRTQPGYFSKFYARRALRIFPLYYGVLLLLWLLTPVLHLQWHLGHLLYLVYAGNFASCWRPALVNVLPDVTVLHLWSLAVEEQFYLVWPLVVFLLPSPRVLVRVCGGLSLLALALRVVLMLTMSAGDASQWSYAMLPTHMDGLLYGSIAAALVRTLPAERMQAAARRVLVGAAAGVLAVWLAVGLDIYSRLMILAGFPLLALLFAALLVRAMDAETWISRLGNWRVLRFFGKYSYGLYVFHLLFAPALSKYQPRLQGALHSVVLGGIAYVLLTLLGTCVAAVLSYQLYEKHWLRLKRHFAYRRTEPASAGAVTAS